MTISSSTFLESHSITSTSGGLFSHSKFIVLACGKCLGFFIWKCYCLVVVLFSFVCMKIFFSLCLFPPLIFTPYKSPSHSSQWGCGDTFWAVLGVNYNHEFHDVGGIPKIWCIIVNLICFIRSSDTAFCLCLEFLELVKYQCLFLVMIIICS